jgi:hypothetical protein
MCDCSNGMFVLYPLQMCPDPKDELNDREKKPVPPSETVANAHASGDGSLERSDGSIEEGNAGSKPEKKQDHTPY